MSPRRCIPPETHFTFDPPCTPHTISTVPTTSPTLSSQSCPHPRPLTVTEHGPAPTLAKDQTLKVLASTSARLSVATVVIAEPTPQIALSAAAATATELVHLSSAVRSSPPTCRLDF
jgi:hypothetical protein